VGVGSVPGTGTITIRCAPDIPVSPRDPETLPRTGCPRAEDTGHVARTEALRRDQIRLLSSRCALELRNSTGEPRQSDDPPPPIPEAGRVARWVHLSMAQGRIQAQKRAGIPRIPGRDSTQLPIHLHRSGYKYCCPRWTGGCSGKSVPDRREGGPGLTGSGCRRGGNHRFTRSRVPRRR
jgi:hypothetical protein